MVDEMDKRVSLLEEAFERHEERISAHGKEIDTLRMNREHDSVVLAQVNSTCLDIKVGEHDDGRRERHRARGPGIRPRARRPVDGLWPESARGG